jgi:hypothetical protein
MARHSSGLIATYRGGTRHPITPTRLAGATILGATIGASLAVPVAAFASPTSDDNAPLTQAGWIPLEGNEGVSYDDTEYDPATMEPDAYGDGIKEYTEWVAAGMPGYIADEGGSKGVAEATETDSGIGAPPALISSNWDAVALCESGGNWSINTGNGFYGGLQIWEPTWIDFGGWEFASLPHEATKAEQIIVAERILAVQGKGAWPSCGQFLQDVAPAPAPEPECALGPGSNLGLSTNADFVYKALCFHFPQITTYGGLRPGDPQDHGTGNALDAMVYGDSATGDAVLAFLLEHIEEFDLKYVIWSQRIYGSWNGWSAEWMPDRGSGTQNHYDHVHISVN